MAGYFFSIILLDRGGKFGQQAFEITSDMFYRYFGDRVWLDHDDPGRARFTIKTASEIAFAMAKEKFGEWTEWDYYSCPSGGDG